MKNATKIVVYPNRPLFHGSLIKNWGKLDPLLCMNNEADPEHRPQRIQETKKKEGGGGGMGWWVLPIVVYPNRPLFHGSLINNWGKLDPSLCMNNEMDYLARHLDHRP